jgi:hypothetical protein
MQPIPGFIGPTYQDLSRDADAQDTINLFPERDESGSGKNEAVLHAVPGRRLWGTAPDGPIRDVFAQDGLAFAVAGLRLVELQTGGVVVDRGAVLADDNPAAFATNGAGANQLFAVTGGAGYILSLTGARTLTRIGGGFPANASGAAFRDGYFFTTAGGFIYASNVEDGLTWSAASKAQRSIASDNLITMIADDNRVIWLIGTATSEPWFDNAGSPFPLTPVPGAFSGVGTGSGYAIRRFDNSIITLAQNEYGDRIAVIAGAGYKPQRISTHAIETAWGTYARVDDAMIWPYQEGGHTFAVITFPSANASWCYDASSQLWHKRGHWNAPAGRYDADLGIAHCYAFGKHLVGSRVDGSIYEQSMGIYDDAGSPKRWLRRSPYVGKGPDWIEFARFELELEVGQGLATGQGSDPQVFLRYSDDGATSWSYERMLSTGAIGKGRTRVFATRLGTSRTGGRIFEVAGSDPVKTTLIDAYAEAG